MPASAEASIALLHTALVDLVLAKEPVSAPVVAALRAVPRDLFLPDASTEEAYKDNVVVTKRDVYGAPLSSVSRPSTVAAMLEQLQVEPGQQILEIGSGGYNAALLAELTGPTGHVTTIDIDQAVIRRARACLGTAGYTDVTALINDGHFGFPLRAPYDRIVVTVNAPDIPPAWTTQLVTGGRIVIPLQLRGLLRTVGFSWDGEILTSDSMRPYGFVRLQGAGARASSPRMIRIADGIRLDIDDDQDADPDALRGAISGPSHIHSTGVALSPAADALPSLDLWLATVQPTYGRLHGTDTAIGPDLPLLPTPAGVSACWSDDSLAYLTFTPAGGTGVEIGVVAHGPDRYRLADLLTYDVRVWDAERRGGPDPTIRVYPTDASRASAPPGRLLTKPSAQLLITWD
ncbi:methyltransferase, FxLD system [Parafrankia colletiae]|uniref:Protein-L-isoaspartate O-methyltransferase n=1 Tax=Parafrankia colletiae TaxID=573497 RepID=A0A1S1Q378_9ACTN|nr:methyltransferase, FxLD system [Parafrankia colletiae]MCK9904433.1 methyltransferase, FxLD system [Frankia sp. Cpl3]OHV28056.1 methyltransferase, FxLD system [Parafrankia colletiae]